MRTVIDRSPARVRDAHIVITADSQGGSFGPNGFLATGTVMIIFPGITITQAAEIAKKGTDLFPSAYRIIVWATTNKPLKHSYSEWEVSEWMANLHLPLRHGISDQMERDAAMTLQVMKETAPPPAVHLIFVTSPLLGYPAMRHWYSYFTIRLHCLISQTYGSAGEIFETAKGATILTPKREAGYDAAGGEIHIMPHQILLCLADMEFLLQLFLEKKNGRTWRTEDSKVWWQEPFLAEF